MPISGFPLTACRICKSGQLTTFLELGNHPLSDAFLKSEIEFQSERRYPLSGVVCQSCYLVQLGYIVPPEEMFNSDYVYVTGVSRSARRHFEEYAAHCMSTYLKPGACVIEMGSNDGTCLSYFKEKGAVVLGVDPSQAAHLANERGIETVNDFFCFEVCQRICNEKGIQGKVDAVVGANVFAHIHDLDNIMRGVSLLLSNDGIFVTEFPYLGNQIREMQFDTIYHEHLFYFSLRPMLALFERHDFELFDVIETPVLGGSTRVYAQRKGGKHMKSKSLLSLLSFEESAGLYKLETYTHFASRVHDLKLEFISLLKKLRELGKVIVGNGAPAKGNTLLNYCEITSDLIEFIGEINPLKQNTFTPGMHIPVKSILSIEERKPDYIVILPWNLKQDIMNEHKEHAERGGRFIIPIPWPCVIDGKGNILE